MRGIEKAAGGIWPCAFSCPGVLGRVLWPASRGQGQDVFGVWPDLPVAALCWWPAVGCEGGSPSALNGTRGVTLRPTCEG